MSGEAWDTGVSVMRAAAAVSDAICSACGDVTAGVADANEVAMAVRTLADTLTQLHRAARSD